jgi:hypothetical protein
LVSLIEFRPLNNALKGALTYDFSSQYDKLIANTNSTLKRQFTPQLYIDGKVDNVTAESVDAGPDGLTAIVDAHGMAAIHSGRLPQ